MSSCTPSEGDDAFETSRRTLLRAHFSSSLTHLVSPGDSSIKYLSDGVAVI